MMSIVYIAAHECRCLLVGIMGWLLLAVVQFLLGVLFLFFIHQFVDSSATAIFANHGVSKVVIVGFLQLAGVLLLLVVPVVTMSSFSGERQTDSIVLLLSSPVSLSECVLGKYLGIMSYFSLLLGVVMLMPLSLLMATEIDLLQLLSAFVGLWLLVSACVAIGLFVSALSSQPAVAAAGTYGVLLLLWLVDLVSDTDSEVLSAVLRYLSLLSHYHDLLDGAFYSVDIVYYLLVSSVFLILSIWYLDNARM